jgi:hypothetical protein
VRWFWRYKPSGDDKDSADTVLILSNEYARIPSDRRVVLALMKTAKTGGETHHDMTQMKKNQKKKKKEGGIGTCSYAVVDGMQNAIDAVWNGYGPGHRHVCIVLMNTVPISLFFVIDADKQRLMQMFGITESELVEQPDTIQVLRRRILEAFLLFLQIEMEASWPALAGTGCVSRSQLVLLSADYPDKVSLHGHNVVHPLALQQVLESTGGQLVIRPYLFRSCRFCRKVRIKTDRHGTSKQVLPNNGTEALLSTGTTTSTTSSTNTTNEGLQLVLCSSAGACCVEEARATCL